MMHPSLATIFDPSFDGFFVIAGPCAIEDEDISYQIAAQCQEICKKLDIPFVCKGSYRKANRTSAHSFRGIGDQAALDILANLKRELNIAMTTDVHETNELPTVAKIVDLIQIPAFLSRQTALIEAAAQTGQAMNIKKGQFMSASSALEALHKANNAGGRKVMLTERGNSFGYNDLIVDYRNIAIMAEKCITVMDCSHATQQPNLGSLITGGQSEYIELLARNGLMSGAKGIFVETHPFPHMASSDSLSMQPLSEMADMLYRLKVLHESYKRIYG